MIPIELLGIWRNLLTSRFEKRTDADGDEAHESVGETENEAAAAGGVKGGGSDTGGGGEAAAGGSERPEGSSARGLGRQQYGSKRLYGSAGAASLRRTGSSSQNNAGTLEDFTAGIRRQQQGGTATGSNSSRAAGHQHRFKDGASVAPWAGQSVIEEEGSADEMHDHEDTDAPKAKLSPNQAPRDGTKGDAAPSVMPPSPLKRLPSQSDSDDELTIVTRRRLVVAHDVALRRRGQRHTGVIVIYICWAIMVWFVFVCAIGPLPRRHHHRRPPLRAISYKPACTCLLVWHRSRASQLILGFPL